MTPAAADRVPKRRCTKREGLLCGTKPTWASKPLLFARAFHQPFDAERLLCIKTEFLRKFSFSQPLLQLSIYRIPVSLCACVVSAVCWQILLSFSS